MKTMPCPREEEVVAAVIGGNLDGLLAGHVASCESCRAAAKITSLLLSDREYKVQDTLDVRSRNMIWAKATMKMRARQRLIQRLGSAIGIVLGVFASWLTSLVVSPFGMKVSYEQAAVLLSHSLILLLPTIVVLAAVPLILYVASHKPDSGIR
jgi:hypothetical protein